MFCRLLQLVTLCLMLLTLIGCSDDAAPPKDAADAGPADLTTIEGPKTSKIHDLNLHLEAWLPAQDAAGDLAAADAGEAP